MNRKEFIYHSEQSIKTALQDSEIVKALAAVGFGRDVLLSGLTLRDHIKTTGVKQKNEYGEKLSATDALKQARHEAIELYNQHVATARFALKDDREAYQSLALAGERKRALLEWLEQAETFYTNVAAYTSVLKKYNLSSADLTLGQERVAAVAEAYSRQLQEKNEAKEATQSKAEARQAFIHWARRYKQAVQLAFGDQPKILARLGYPKKQAVS
uniref:Uncharacterized protein n=1 Tax=Roseihalotalea indica TaxID=2867963 RepID=A0AA49JEI7_9BACT|nr:hypothetical protein K4G66_18130 [Tunicatimonas sp. TK19036]